jgi:hypothetical protein
MAEEAGAMEDGAAEVTTVAATMVAKASGAGPWLADQPITDVVHLVAGTAGGSVEALRVVGFTAAVASMAAVVSTAADTGRLNP